MVYTPGRVFFFTLLPICIKLSVCSYLIMLAKRNSKHEKTASYRPYSWFAHDIIKIKKSKLYVLQSCF